MTAGCKEEILAILRERKAQIIVESRRTYLSTCGKSEGVGNMPDELKEQGGLPAPCNNRDSDSCRIDSYMAGDAAQENVSEYRISERRSFFSHFVFSLLLLRKDLVFPLVW